MQDGIAYQIVDGKMIQRSHVIGKFEILLSEGMSVEDQIRYIVWKDSIKNNNI